ncbi:MAG: CRTAC1 family protein [Woeseia sp.]|nr:CRTAC1 family protein [Woeseia sp.]
MNRAIKLLRRLVIVGVVFSVIVVIVGTIAWQMYPRRVIAELPFVSQELDINSLDYYDVGAVDLNRDGHLDLFTTNHSSRQSLLIANGNGGYNDALTTHGFDQDRELPGLEDVGHAPEFSGPGLYIYFVQSTLHFRYIPVPNAQSVSGSIQIPGRPEIVDEDGIETSITRAPDDEFSSIIGFTTDADGRFSVAVTKSAPLSVSLDDDFPLREVRVGAYGIEPQSHEFELYLKDRHGIAWADINHDSVTDAYMSRGALFGTLAGLPGEMGDQFFVSASGGQFDEHFSELGFEKRNCPARQVAWTDVNNDDRLDLYIACGRQVGGFWEYVPTALRTNRDEAPNMLYVQTVAGDFREEAAAYGLDFKVGGTFLWLDVDLDSDADLLWASENEIALYRQTNSGFVPEVLIPGSTTIQPRKLAVADFDADGDLDVYVAASLGSKLLINDAGRLHAEDPAAIGLPSRVRTVAWVDYDNDGQTDLYSWPSGLFRQTASGQFEDTGLLRMPSPYWALIDPRVLWFDYDNDGDRDFLVMQRYFPQVIQKAFSNTMPFTADFLRNDSDDSVNWIQVELHGSPGNRDAIGSTVTLITNQGREAQQVGQSDSSHYSQGHYRLYFSIGNETEPEMLEVTWPDGIVQQIHQPTAGQTLRIEKLPELDSIQ